MSAKLKQNQQHRRDVLRLLLWVTFIGGCGFCLLNIIHGMWALAVLEMFYGLFSFSLLRIVKNTPNLRNWVLAYLLPFFCIMMYALFLPGTSTSVFAWILTIPVISYLLLGRSLGMWFSIIFVTIGISVYHYRFMVDSLPLNLLELMNIVLSSVALITFAHVYERNREVNEQRLLALAGTDRLTGLANRMKFSEDFYLISSATQRDNFPLSVVVVDLDFFKRINDQFGHDAGDKALCHAADLLASQVRENDLVARLGGEEFALVLLSCDRESAIGRMNQIRQQFSQSPLLIESVAINITFSAGIAVYGEDGDDIDTLISKADRRLYLAKRNGRNQVIAIDEL